MFALQELGGPNSHFHTQKDFEKLEQLQGRARRMMKGSKRMLHSVRCKMINLFNSSKRWFRGDLIRAYENPYGKQKSNRGLSILGKITEIKKLETEVCSCYKIICSLSATDPNSISIWPFFIYFIRKTNHQIPSKEYWLSFLCHVLLLSVFLLTLDY